MIQRRWAILGTWVELSFEPLASWDHVQQQRALRVCAAVLQLVQTLMSVHDRHSALSQLNQTAHQQPVSVHPWLWCVLLRALRLYHASSGHFDCAVAGAELCAWGLMPDHRHPALRAETQSPTLQALHCLPEHKVWFSQPLYLDLGGIAKGFAVDMVILALHRLGVRQAVVNAGGDLRVLGAQAQLIQVRHPHDPQQVMVLGELAAGACATSASYYSQQHDTAGQLRCALVETQQRQAVLQPHSYTVLAPTAIMADGLTKVTASMQQVDSVLLAQFGAHGILLAPAIMRGGL